MKQIIAKTEELVIERMAKSRTPGVVVSFYKNNEILWMRGFGTEDVIRQTEIKADTKFCISSLSKTFTTIAIMKLMEDKVICLDEPVDTYLPFSLRPKGVPITFHHLLTHTSGYPSLGLSEASILAANGKNVKYPLVSWDDLFAFLRDMDNWVVSSPGERFFYWNEGFEILGYIIGKVTDQSYKDYLQQHVLSTLGMENTRLTNRNEKSVPGIATPHRRVNENIIIPDVIPGSCGCYASGGIITSAKDMHALFGTLVEAKGARKVLSPESIHLMHQPYIKENASPFGQQYYGYGLYTVRDENGIDYWGHGGSIGTTHTDFRYNRETKIGVFVSGNGDFPASLVSWYALMLLEGKDVDKHPAIRSFALSNQLAGIYYGFRDVSCAEVQVTWPQIDIIEKESGKKTILIVSSIEGNIIHCRDYVGLEKYLNVEFHIFQDRIDLILERRMLRKS